MSEAIKDGLVIPPGEKSEAEYRAKIARGEVQCVTFRADAAIDAADLTLGGKPSPDPEGGHSPA